MLEDNIKNNVNGSGCKRYTIPRKQRLLSEDCQRGIPLDSREAREIINTVHHLTWESAEEFDHNYVISKIYKVENQVLEREFQTKRTELRDEGRSVKELSEYYAFKAEHYGTAVREQCMKGLYCNDSNSVLGDGKMGINVWKCPDLCLKTLKWPDSWTVFLIVFRIIKGKVKPVTPKQPNQDNNLEPTPNYDCHVAKNVQYSSTTDIATLMIKTQYYLYEYDEEGLARDRPRHCLPFAVIHVNKTVTAQPETKQLEAIMSVHLASEDVPDTSAQETKLQYLTENDGKMAWRGLMGSKESSLGIVAIKAGHKLGLTLWKSFIDVRNKLPMNSLLKVIPGDIRTAWDKPLHYRGHTLSLCIVKPCGPADKFISFIKSLSMKEHAAGVVTVDSSTVMFLVPSSKLSVDLGLCEDEEPWRMFCIVRRRLRRYPPSDTNTQSCINTQANQPTSIEPQGLNINLKFEVSNLTKGIEELKVIRPSPQPVGFSLSRSMSVDCTRIRSKNTLLRRVSDTGCQYNKNNKLQKEARPSSTLPLQVTPQQRLLLSTLPPPQQPPQVKHLDDGTKPKKDDFDFNNDFSKKVSLFRFDNIPFLEHTDSPPEVDENNAALLERTTHQDKHGAGSNHSDDNSDVIMERADGICSSHLTNSTQKDRKTTEEDVRNDDKYQKHLQTLVPCKNNTKNTNPIKTSPRQQESYDMTDTEPSINQDKDNRQPSSRGLPSSRDLSPRSFGVYNKHKETLKRKSTLPGHVRENVKKRKLDPQQDIPDPDSSRGLYNERGDALMRKEQVSNSEHGWTSGLQVIELMLIEQDFQKTDEKIECLEKQNALEILDVDSVTEIIQYEATTVKELHGDGLGNTKTDGQLAGHSCQLEQKQVEENVTSTVMTLGWTKRVRDQALSSKGDLDMKPQEDFTLDLPSSVSCTQPSIKLEQHHHTSDISSQDPTKSTMSSQKHTNSNMSSQNHTNSTMSNQNHTNSTMSSQNHTNINVSSQNHINRNMPNQDHSNCTISSQVHTNSTMSSERHTNSTIPSLYHANSTISSQDSTNRHTNSTTSSQDSTNSHTNSTMSSQNHTNSTMSSQDSANRHTNGTIYSQNHTNSNMPSQNHTNCTMSSHNHTNCTMSSQDSANMHTNSTIYSRNHTNSNMSSQNHTNCTKSSQDSANMHTNSTIYSQNHTNSNMSSQNHTNCTMSSQVSTNRHINSNMSSESHTNCTMSSQNHTNSYMSSQNHTNSTMSSQDLTNSTSPFLNEKENYKSKTSVAPQSEMKTQGSSKPVSDPHNRSIPYCYSGSSHLLYHPPPLKSRRLVTDNPRINPRYHRDPPHSPARINNTLFPPLPNERFCRLPSLHGALRMPLSRPPLLFFPNGFSCRPPLLPRPSVAQYMCHGDKRKRVL